MARPCYIYNLLKLPGLEGIITVRGNPKKARECEEGAAAFAEAMLHAEEYQEIKEAMSPSEMPATEVDQRTSTGVASASCGGSTGSSRPP